MDSRSLSQLATQYGVPVETLELDYKKFLAEEAKLHKDMPKELRVERAENRLFTQYKRFKISETDTFVGFVFANRNPTDFNINMIKAANIAAASENWKRYTNKKGVLTVLVNKKPVKVLLDMKRKPLDARATFRSGDANRNFGQPLNEHSYNKMISAWCYLMKGTKKIGPKELKIRVSSELADVSSSYYLDPPTFVPVQFRAKMTSKIDDAIWEANATSITKFEETSVHPFPTVEYEGQDSLDIYRIVKSKGLSHYCCELAHLASYLADSDPNDFDKIVMVQGLVVSIDSTQGRSDRMYIDTKNGSKPLLCWVDKRMGAKVGEGSKVIVSAKLAKDTKDKDRKGLGVFCNICGIFVDPKFKFEREVVELTPENKTEPEVDVSEAPVKTIHNKKAKKPAEEDKDVKKGKKKPKAEDIDEFLKSVK
jgi:hypothetical protein